MNTIRIGNAAGFWGDSLDAPVRLAEGGRVDYLTLEYLAELTMSILAHLKSKDAAAGYVTDFPPVLQSLAPHLREQPGLRIVTNAGGMNPRSCAVRAARILADAGLGDAAVAAVSGDNLLAELDDHLAAGEPFANLDTGEPLGERRAGVVCANAYLGARGIADALAQQARVVITGRVADASLTLGPAVHEFGWGWDDWDRLAAATVAGHLIECGAQATGGMHSDWTEDWRLADVGYPIAELSCDGGTVLTKPPGTGGAVTIATAAEQLVYEIGDPAHYLTPDVDADFSGVRLAQAGADRVAVSGASGRSPPDRYKVSMACRDGYMVSGTLTVYGRDCVRKARAAAEMVFARVRRAGYDLARTHVECLGSGDSVPGVWRRPADSGFRAHDPGAQAADRPGTFEPPEVVLRIAAHDQSREAVERLARELAPLVTSGPPGVTGYTGARPRPHPVLAYWPTTIARERVAPQVTVRAAGDWQE